MPEQIEKQARTLAYAARAAACRVTQEPGSLLLEIPKPELQRRALLAERLEEFKPARPTAVPAGITTGGRVLWLDIADERMAHVLIGGVTGTGKSVLLKYILMRLLRQNKPGELALIAADPKVGNREGLLPFVHAGHLLHPIQDDTVEVVRLLRWVRAEMQRREVVNETTPRLLVVIEEVAHYTDENKDVVPLLKKIAQVSRSWGIHLLVTTQHPGAKSLGDAIENIPCTFMGRVARGTQVYGATGRKGTGADELLQRGDMLCLSAGEVTHFQAPYATNQWIWTRVPKGGPRSLDGQLPRTDRIDTGAVRGGRRGRDVTDADIERVRSAVLAGRGVEYVRQTLRIGTDKARTLHTAICKGEM